MLKRIEQKEAEQYISVNEDYTKGGLENATFFTLTPSTSKKYPASDGWEDVTYYTLVRKICL
jgi:hypothetical protein